jgi:hypothetical protein
MDLASIIDIGLSVRLTILSSDFNVNHVDQHTGSSRTRGMVRAGAFLCRALEAGTLL